MKAVRVINTTVKALAICAVLALAITAVAQQAPKWRWRVDTWTAVGTNTVTLQASTGGEIAWVRWNAISGPTNEAAAAVTLVSAADSYQTTLATLSVSNAAETAVSAQSSMATVSNAQWRAGDSLTTSAQKVTNGTFAVGYWYYE